jgi:hypothetical protein
MEVLQRKKDETQVISGRAPKFNTEAQGQRLDGDSVRHADGKPMG